MQLSRSIVGQAEADAVAAVIKEDGYLGMGRATRDFETDIAAYLGVDARNVISVNSGTAALHVAVETILASLDKPPTRPKVLVPSLTFVASFQAIRAAGCEPVACDVLENTGTISLADAETRLTEDVIALMHVDYASNPWRLEEVYAFAARNGIRMIDDAAHAFGCRHHGRKIGSFGDLVCFSFDGIKNITCGEGGCIIAFDPKSAQIAADKRLLGVEGDTAKRFAGARSWDPDVKFQGWRYHMSNIMAAIGRVQLSRLENEFIPARRHLYEIYRKTLAGAPRLALLETDPQDYIVPHIMPVRILEGRRDAVAEALADADIPTGMHYKPNHLLTLFGGGAVSLPGAEQLYSELLTLPLHPGLGDADIAKVCQTVLNALE